MTSEPKRGSPESFETYEDPLAKAIKIIELALSASTGHNDYQRRKIAYYAVATYFIGRFDPFPGLVPYGPPASGKTATLLVLRKTCWRPIAVTGETITPAALKQRMANSNEGTLIIEEGDKLSDKELEGILITRYSRASGMWSKMVPDGEGWALAEYRTSGATVVHRRNLFKDPALLRRVITVRTSRRKKDYVPLNPDNPIFEPYFKYMMKLPELPEVRNIWKDVQAGIFDCYKPLLAIATFLEDDEFIDELVKEMVAASLRLKTEETYLDPPTLLKVLIGLVAKKTESQFTLKRISILASDLTPALMEEFGSKCSVLMLSANQRNRIIEEDLGFKVISSGGKQKVYLTIPLLIEKCDEYGVEDSLIEEWRSHLGSLKKKS